MKRSVGGQPKVTYSTLYHLADLIQHNRTVSDACRIVGVSRDTFYRYLNNDPEFTELVITAYENQNKVVMSFTTAYSPDKLAKNINVL